MSSGRATVDGIGHFLVDRMGVTAATPLICRGSSEQSGYVSRGKRTGEAVATELSGTPSGLLRSAQYARSMLELAGDYGRR